MGGPNGQDRLLAIASSKELDLRDIATFAQNQSFAQVKVKGQENLAKALSIVVNPLPADGWTTDVVTFKVGGQPVSTPVNPLPGTATGTVTITPGQGTQPAPQPTQPAPAQPAPTTPAPS